MGRQAPTGVPAPVSSGYGAPNRLAPEGMATGQAPAQVAWVAASKQVMVLDAPRSGTMMWVLAPPIWAADTNGERIAPPRSMA